ncbi:hypothetical protein LTR15_000181 [Elasticomyces elasticus]|nr:hypothetical protein LTR15_000181 [Elasticomyces elasticus]
MAFPLCPTQPTGPNTDPRALNFETWSEKSPVEFVTPWDRSLQLNRHCDQYIIFEWKNQNGATQDTQIQAPAAPTAAPQLPAENQEDEHASDNEMSDCESHTSQASHDDTTSEYVPSESRASIASQDFEQSKRKRGKDKGKTVSRHGCRSDHAALCDERYQACYAFDERDQDDEEMLPAVKEEDIVKEENIGEEEHIEEDHDAMGSLRMLSLEPRTE